MESHAGNTRHPLGPMACGPSAVVRKEEVPAVGDLSLLLNAQVELAVVRNASWQEPVPAVRIKCIQLMG